MRVKFSDRCEVTCSRWLESNKAMKNGTPQKGTERDESINGLQQSINGLQQQINGLQQEMSGDTIPLDQHEERGGWSNQCDFFLSCLGYAVGLGNVWRFPYLCYKNGGGAFLIPYAISLVITGIPIFFLELALGQYASLGPNLLFRKLSPIFSGLGYGMLIVTILTGLYYNMIIAWTVFYLFASFTSDLPWRTCSGDWAGQNCYSPDEARACLESSNGTRAFFNKTCVDIETLCSSNDNPCADPAYKGCPKKLMNYHNNTHCLNTTSDLHGEPEYLYVKINRAVDYVLPAQEYFQNYMLRRSDSMEDYGTLQWPLVLCLLFAWLMVGGSLIKGVKSSGKVVYFTALFPYVVLVALLIKGAPLDGAFDGIVFYIQPNWKTLLGPEVWVTATTQIFYSLSPAFGGLLTLSSYNRFDNNCQRDAILVAISNCATSVFAGFVIFSIVGHMAFLLDKPVGEVIKSGPGLAFIAYPQALAQMTVAPLWAIIFFVMLITLGLDSQFVMVETVTTAMFDEWPSLRMYKSKVVVAVCAVGWLLGLLFCTPGGIYLFNLIDSYAAGYSLLLIAIAEIILVTYVYGYVRFSENIKQMIGPQNIFLRLYWSCTWHILAPVLLTGILIFSLVDYTPAKYDDYVYPGWAQCLGWFMALISIAMIPIFAIYMYHKGRRMGLSLRDLVEPTPDWGPAHLRNTSRNNLVLQQHRPAQAHDN